jgi:hypothetical protein
MKYRQPVLKVEMATLYMSSLVQKPFVEYVCHFTQKIKRQLQSGLASCNGCVFLEGVTQLNVHSHMHWNQMNGA